MKTKLEYKDAIVTVEDVNGDIKRVTSQMKNQNDFCPRTSLETRYSLDLIKAIIDVKGTAWLCDEIAREEDPLGLQTDLSILLSSYLKKEDLTGKHILDFGCGCGGSTLNIYRMFSNSFVFGVELEEKFLNVANIRAKHYGFQNITFLNSPKPNKLPHRLGEFDFIFLFGVYEHLLPNERTFLLLQIWDHLKIGGMMFLIQTPDRRFPIETHTTKLPLVNYLPNKIVLFLTNKFSKKVDHTASWSELLRAGIRGATPREIRRILSQSPFSPILVHPDSDKIKRQSDIWYSSARRRLSKRYKGLKKRLIFLSIDFLMGVRIPIAPYISLAVKKSYD
jgi:2-polyprenyl-3-methyl-5-hydroxy-6-metoxy-1,4-benzoquinol methylase